MQEKYKQLQAVTDVQVSLAADDHLFFKACGGWIEKETLYGLGREGPAMFEIPKSLGIVATALHRHIPPR